jgi:hypothetical protein
MGTREEIQQIEAQINLLSEQVHQTFALRDLSTENWARWQRACLEFNAFDHALLQLWKPDVLHEIAGTRGQWREIAFQFLELDPWFFRSGYLKGKIARAFKAAALAPDEIERLSRILLAIVDSHPRQEFREFCRLAVRVLSPGLVEELSSRAKGSDPGIRARATRMLSSLERHGHVV